MLKKTKLAILAFSFFLVSGAMAANQQPEGGYIPIGGIFIADTMEAEGAPEAESGHKAQSAALAGLLVSVFIVIGAGRAYSQLHSRVQADLALVQQKHAAIIHDSVKIHNNEVVEIMADCEILENEISDLEYQLNQIQGEA